MSDKDRQASEALKRAATASKDAEFYLKRGQLYADKDKLERAAAQYAKAQKRTAHQATLTASLERISLDSKCLI